MENKPTINFVFDSIQAFSVRTWSKNKTKTFSFEIIFLVAMIKIVWLETFIS
jgi:hypothetical protein